jgi:hypothetical protein
MLDEYRSLVGKIMYYTTKLAPELSNAARELASHLSIPGEEHWIELRKCVGYLRYGKNLSLISRKPSELRSISTCDSNYAQDPNDRKAYQEESTQLVEHCPTGHKETRSSYFK